MRKFYKLVDDFHRMWDVVTEFDSLSNLATQMVPVSVKEMPWIVLGWCFCWSACECNASHSSIPRCSGGLSLPRATCLPGRCGLEQFLYGSSKFCLAGMLWS